MSILQNRLPILLGIIFLHLPHTVFRYKVSSVFQKLGAVVSMPVRTLLQEHALRQGGQVGDFIAQIGNLGDILVFWR